MPRKLAWNCEHTDRPQHSRGLCNACYIRHTSAGTLDAFPRSNGARVNDVCGHLDRPHYAKGRCGACNNVAWRSANPEKANLSQVKWRAENPERYKVRSAVARLRAKHPGQPVASVEELLPLLLSYLDRMDLRGAVDVYPEIDLCHYTPVSSGGSGTIENLYWGWTALNKGIGNSKPELALRMLLDMRLEIESRLLRDRQNRDSAA